MASVACRPKQLKEAHKRNEGRRHVPSIIGVFNGRGEKKAPVDVVLWLKRSARPVWSVVLGRRVSSGYGSW